MTPSPSVSRLLASLLAAPLPDIRSYGAMPPRDLDPLKITGGQTSPVSALAALTQELIPLINSFRTPPSAARRWWKMFTGEALEGEVMYFDACQTLEARTAAGVALMHKTEELLTAMLAEEKCIAQDIAQLGDAVAAAQAALGSAHAPARTAAAFAEAGEDYWPRFARRAENLATLLASLQITLAQYALAKTQAQTALDRFSEIVEILMPLWRQRMGFELFSRLITAKSES